MQRRQPSVTRTYTLFPYTPLFRSAAVAQPVLAVDEGRLRRIEGRATGRQVGAGAQGTAGAGDHDRPHIVVRVRPVQPGDRFLAHRRIVGVQLPGPIRSVGEDAVLNLVEQGVVSTGVLHSGPSESTSPGPYSGLRGGN